MACSLESHASSLAAAASGFDDDFGRLEPCDDEF